MSIFDYVEKIKINKNIFDLSFKNSFTCDMGQLVPCLIQETMPGDVFKINASALVKFAPLLAPNFSNCYASIHYWFVPNRLVWSSWNDFITGGEDGQSTPVVPYFTLDSKGLTSFADGTLFDYMGLPKNLDASEKINALPFRAYNLIYNEFYRDEDLQTEIANSMSDGLDTATATDILYRAWPKDYFTSARSTAQLGNGASISLGSTAPVKGNGKTIGLTDGINNGSMYRASGHDNEFMPSGDVDVTLPNVSSTATLLGLGKNVGLTTDGAKSGIVADLANADPISIRDLRYAFQLQKFLERSMRSGNRIKEYLLGHYGVKTSDARLQLPEYLGGVKTQVAFSEVLQTSSSTSSSPQGNMAGHGVSLMGKNIRKPKYIEEHGYIIGLFSVIPIASYSQGLHRKFSKETRFDFALPVFQHIGEQAVKVKELYANASDPDDTFGYQSRYAEYKFNSDEFHGDFRGNLNYWHMGREFANEPALNSSFIQCQPSNRIFAVTASGVNHLYVNLYNQIKVKRSLDYFSSPGLVDHF